MAKVASKTVGDNLVRFQFANGKTIVCHVGDLGTDIIDRLALHGIAQKVGDAYASATSVDEAYANAMEVWKNLQNGLWATRATGGKIIEAMSRATGKTMDECLEAYNRLDDEGKKNLKKHPAIKKAMAEIDAERAAAQAAVTDSGPDLSSLFN